MIRERQNPLETGEVASDDERNVDEQLDEAMTLRDEAERRPPLENHTNNTRVEPRDASEPPDLPKRE